MNRKLFWTLSPNGNQVLRDLEKENETFTPEDFQLGKFDSNNFQWFEMFQHYSFDANGCDYERKGCVIKEGDVVLDLGANIGIFAHRAELRGASKVICFEPIGPTFECLIKNKGPKTIVYKNAVGSENKFINFKIPSDFTHIGGASSLDSNIGDRSIIHNETAYMININEIFKNIGYKIDFLKIDIEGGEVDVLTSITDENLSSLRCVSIEMHNTYESFTIFHRELNNRFHDLGFKHFTLYHGDDGVLSTLTAWKE